MKNKLTILACMLVAITGWSQNDLRFGFQMSPTLSRITTDNNRINPNGPNLGLKLGMIGEYNFRENYSFSTGIGFHFNAGGTILYEDILDTISIWREADIPGSNIYPGGTNFKYSMQYVEIPLGLKLRTREFGYLRYFLEPQVQLGFRTQARGVIKNATGVDAEEKFNISSAVNLFNLSWGLSGGIEYGVSDNTALVAGFGFQSGFADISKNKGTQIIDAGRSKEDTSKAKITSFILRLGVMF